MKKNEVKVNGTLYVPATNEKYNIKDVKVVVNGRWTRINAGTVTSIFRKVLKANGINPSQFRFKTQVFSGGDSLNVSEKENADTSLRTFMKGMVASFEGGYFDGMNDMYEYSDKKPFFVSEDGVINVDVWVKYGFFNENHG